MWPNPQFPADLVTFTEEIYNRKLFCAVQKRDLLPVGLKSSWGVNPPFARLENMPPSLGSFARLIIWSHSSSVKKFGISRKEQNYFKNFHKRYNIIGIHFQRKLCTFVFKAFYYYIQIAILQYLLQVYIIRDKVRPYQTIVVSSL